MRASNLQKSSSKSENVCMCIMGGGLILYWSKNQRYFGDQAVQIKKTVRPV